MAFSISGLIKDLQQQGVSASNQYLYVVLTLLFFPAMYSNQTQISGFESLIFYGALFLLEFLGISYAYVINKRGDNKNFIERFISLRIVILINVGLAIGLMIAGLSGLFLILAKMGRDFGFFKLADINLESSYLYGVLFISIYFLTYLWVFKAMKKVLKLKRKR